MIVVDKLPLSSLRVRGLRDSWEPYILGLGFYLIGLFSEILYFVYVWEGQTKEFVQKKLPKGVPNYRYLDFNLKK